MTSKLTALERNPQKEAQLPESPTQGDLRMEAKQRFFQTRAWRNFTRNRFGVLGLLILTIMVVMVIAAPWVTRYTPSEGDAFNMFKRPGSEHWLGTDQIGRDIWARVVYGGRVSLFVGTVAVLLQTLIGSVMGVVSGYFGGTVDMLIQRLVEVMQVFPDLMFLLILVSLLGPGIANLFLAIALLYWYGVCRLVRGQVLSIRATDYIMAASAVGVPDRRIIFRHIMPNLMGIILVSMITGVGGAILLEAGLSYLGLGVQPPTPSWGNLIQQANSLTALKNRPWLWVPPGVMMVLCVLSFNFVGDAIRDVFDPHRQR